MDMLCEKTGAVSQEMFLDGHQQERESKDDLRTLGERKVTETLNSLVSHGERQKRQPKTEKTRKCMLRPHVPLGMKMNK